MTRMNANIIAYFNSCNSLTLPVAEVLEAAVYMIGCFTYVNIGEICYWKGGAG